MLKRYLVTLSVLCCGMAEVCAEDADRYWRYDYFDGFDTTKAVTDSIRHSVFHFQQTTVPEEPYLWYWPNMVTAERGLVFVGLAVVGWTGLVLFFSRAVWGCRDWGYRVLSGC